MQTRRFVICVTSLLLFQATTTTAQAQFSPYPPNRPDLFARTCGPDWIPGPLRAVVPQGFMGADFRSACYRHDVCYQTSGMPRAYCDRRLYNEMSAACSRSAWPQGCRFVGGFMYGATRVFGSSGYLSGQRLGRGGLFR